MRIDWPSALHARLAAGHDAVLITVARSEGSVPREAGASMVVDAETTAATVGGGHLEWQAVAHARRLLATGDRRADVQRYNLGARLGQCCGGVVWLLFETIPAKQHTAWAARLQALAAGRGLQRQLEAGASAADWNIVENTSVSSAELQGGPEHWQFRQDIVGERFPVYLFGAGHVARALVRQLVPLGATLTWIDSRDDGFDGADTSGTQTLITDVPEAEVAHAPPGTCFIVMTHSHALDFSLCEAIYARRDFAYFGLIGSRTKRVSFEHRLLERGLLPERLAELTCPIGIPGIVGKEPAEIALAVAAELLQIHHARQLLHQAGRPRRIDSPVQPE